MAQEQRIIMGISIDYDKDKTYKNHNRHSHVCRLYFSDESRNCTKFEYSCLRGNGTVCTVCGSSYFERMLLQNTALLLSVQHWQLENGGRKFCDFVSGIYRNYFVNVDLKKMLINKFNMTR